MSNVVTATAKLYLRVAERVIASLAKHSFKPLTGFVFIFVNGLVESNAGLFPGFAGGMLIGLAMTFILSGFISVIVLISDTKKFDLQDTVSLTTSLFGPLINSLFILFIARFLLQPILMQVDSELWTRIIYIILFVLFNPLPEIVCRKGIGGLEAFKEALEFMKENGPEWLLALCLMFLPLFIISGPLFVLQLISVSDPLNGLFSLIRYSVLIFASLLNIFSLQNLGLPMQLLLMTGGLYYVFFVFLFRIALFDELSRSTRRKRVFQDR